MNTQGLKRLASNQGVLQLLLASSSRTVTIAAAPMRAFSVVNTEQVGINSYQGKLYSIMYIERFLH
jgi:hypothetical protein